MSQSRQQRAMNWLAGRVRVLEEHGSMGAGCGSSLICCTCARRRVHRASPANAVPAQVVDIALATMASPEYDYLFKLLLIGDSGVGKSRMLFRSADGAFSESYGSTIGVDFKIHTLEHEGKTIKTQNWALRVRSISQTITSSNFMGCSWHHIVYDLTENRSQNVKNWVSEIDKHAARGVNKLLAGNKCDLAPKKAVSTDEAEDLAR